MNACGDPRCGEPQQGAGRPRAGWIRLHATGTGEPDSWWCSRRCIGATSVTFATRVYLREPPAETRLEDLNRLAGGERLTVMTATPARVRRKLEQAFERVLAEVDEQARLDARGRPTTDVLLAEATGERIATGVCSRCRLEKAAAEFYPVTGRPDAVSGWCRACSAARDSDAVAAS